jgi:hypothetical protein
MADKPGEQDMDRRTFLKSVVIASGATAIAPSGLISASAASPPKGRVVTKATADKQFVQGTVIQQKPGEVVLRSSRFRAQRVRIHPITSIWRGGSVGEDSIRSGDFLYVTGVYDANRVLNALEIHANIGWFEGEVKRSEVGRIGVGTATFGDRSIDLRANTQILKATSPGPHVGAISEGASVRALGLYLPDGGMIATRVWVGPAQSQ